MKTTFHSLLLALFLLSGTATAQERIYVTTDRPAYLAGERVYCSLFSIDGNGRKSNFSAVSYVELISAQGTAAEAKMGLFMGRGSGTLLLPEGLPTGNYALAAYTAGGEPAPEGIRRIAVFNPVSSARVPGGVTIDPDWLPVRSGNQPSDLLSISHTGTPSPGKTSSELKKETMKYLRGALASYKRPKVVEFVEELPKTTSGKVRRVEIKDKDWKQDE